MRWEERRVGEIRISSENSQSHEKNRERRTSESGLLREEFRNSEYLITVMRNISLGLDSEVQESTGYAGILLHLHMLLRTE
jgi:hypothetical protein